jgi:hypothetical protein
MQSPHTCRSILPVVTIVIGLWCAQSASAQVLDPEWNHRFGDYQAQGVNALVVDHVGNTVIVGQFEGTVNFGGMNLVSAGGYDMFVAKFFADGSHQWSARFGSAGNQIGFDVDVDDYGYVYVVGYFENTVDFGGSTHTSAGDMDIFLVKFSPSGVFNWSDSYGSADHQIGRGVCATGTSKVYITGYFQNQVDFGDGVHTSAGSHDIFLAQFSTSSGYCFWSHSLGDATLQVAQRVVANNLGEVVIIGDAQGTVNFGGSPLTSAGGRDLVIAKFNSFGYHDWSDIFGDALDQEGIDVAYHPSNRSFVVTGRFMGTLDLGGIPLVSAGDYDTFLGRFDHNGNHVWSHRYGGPLWTEPSGVDIGSVTSSIVLTGNFQGTANFGGDPLTSAGDRDAFIATYSLYGGVHELSQRFGDSGSQKGKDVAYDSSEDIRLTGDFTGSIDFGLGPLSSAGDRDICLVRFGPPFSGLPDAYTTLRPQLRMSPNPFGLTTNLTYTLPQAGWVSLSVHDAEGRRLQTLIDRFLTAGEHSLRWQAEGQTRGVRYLQLEVNGQREAQTILRIE